jgi:hypothetical protein
MTIEITNPRQVAVKLSYTKNGSAFQVGKDLQSFLEARGWTSDKVGKTYATMTPPADSKAPFLFNVNIPTREQVEAVAQEKHAAGQPWAGKFGEWIAFYFPPRRITSKKSDPFIGQAISETKLVGLTHAVFHVGVRLFWDAEVWLQNGSATYHESASQPVQLQIVDVVSPEKIQSTLGTPDMDRRTKAKLNRNEAARLKEKWDVNAVEVHYREIGNWYVRLKRFPAALFDRHGYILFPTEEAYLKPSPYIYIGKQTGVPKGISAIPGYVRFPISEWEESIIDIEKIKSSKNDPTTKKAQIDARLGQGKFGSDVREQWNHCCCVTGSSTAAVLEASHIKRWADSNDTERLDPNNGLLLTANLHKLFDAGLISFDDSGKMLISSTLSQSEQEIFGVIGKRLSKKPSPETANYLSYHRKKFSQ